MQPEKGERGLWYVGTVGFATKEEAQAYIDRGYKHFGDPTPLHSQGTKSGVGLYTVIGIVVVAAVAFGAFRFMINGKTNANPQNLIDSGQCVAGSKITEREYRPVRETTLRKSWKTDSAKLVNQKATSNSGEMQYQKIDGSMKILEECTYKDASYIRVIEPDYMRARAGWVSEHDLKEKDNPEDPYEGKIARYIFDDFVPDIFEGEGAKFKAEKARIDAEKILAAKKVIDSGQCEYVEGSLFILTESTLKSRKYIVDCSNKRRFTLLSGDLIGSDSQVLSDDKRAVSQTEAAKICKNLVQTRAKDPRSLTFDEIIGASYYKAPTTGNVRYIVDFEAKNAVGTTQKFKATYMISADGGREVEIRSR